MSNSDPTGNGWSGYQRLVLDKLERLDADIKYLRADISELRNEEISDMKVEIAMLKIKAGIWGAAAGFIPASLIVVLSLVKGL